MTDIQPYCRPYRAFLVVCKASFYHTVVPTELGLVVFNRSTTILSQFHGFFESQRDDSMVEKDVPLLQFRTK